MEDFGGIGVKDMRSVLVDEESRIVETIIGIAANMRAAVDHQDPLSGLGRQSFGHDRPRKPRADDHHVIA